MTYCIRFHPLVARDLDAIAQWILDYAGPGVAARKLAEIEAAIATAVTPDNSSIAILTPPPHQQGASDVVATRRIRNAPTRAKTFFNNAKLLRIRPPPTAAGIGHR